MPRCTLLALFVASGLALHSSSAAAQFPAFGHKPHNLADSAGQLRCRFTNGPLAGQTRSLPPSTNAKLGGPCSDGAGSTGEVILATSTSNAGISDIWNKSKYGTEQNKYERPSHPPTLPPSALPSPPPPTPPPPSPVHLPSAAANGAGNTATPPETSHPAPVDRSPASEGPPIIVTHPPIVTSSPPVIAAEHGAAPAPPPDEVQQVHQWYEGLQKGSANYQVPKSMVMGQTYSATAVIHPPTSPTPAAPDAHPLKISPYMRIVLNQTANPGTFDIKPEGNDCKFVSMDADTTWVFDVKPLVPGTNRVLDFAAYVVYGTGDATCKPENLKTIDVLSDKESVTIAAITPRKAWQDIVVSFITDPAKWFKFILPGGLGFAALKWLYNWWKKRRTPKLPSPQPQQTP